jgi:hypothetical protein
MAEAERPDDLVAKLSLVLQPRAIDRWFKTRIRELDGRTPDEALSDGDECAVQAIADHYLDPSFS